jgi:hypothetical protein
MKVFKIKLIRYSTAAGALLAVSANAPAAIIPGTFNAGYPGLDRILDHDDDIVYIDINNDGHNDFYGSFSSGSTFGESYRSAFIEGIGKGDIVENNSSGSDAYLKKFSLNDPIGPSFENPYSYGYIFEFSSIDDLGANSPAALGAPFDPENDGGYVGVSIHTDDGDKFGWIQIAIDENSESVEFIACASESLVNTPIPAGNNATVPLLPIASAAGLGLVGLMAALKRRKKNVTL